MGASEDDNYLNYVNAEQIKYLIDNDITDIDTIIEQINSIIDTEDETEKDKKINEFTSTMDNYKSITTTMDNYNVSNIETQVLTTQNLIDSDVIDSQLNDLLYKLNSIKEQKNNKKRMIEINNYNGDRYENYTKLLKIIFLYIVLIVFFYSLGNYFILPSIITNGIMIIITFLCLSLVFYKFIDIIWRDNMNYQKYNWKWVAPVVDSTPYDESKFNLSSLGDQIENCVGASCCVGDDIEYDITTKHCVTKTSQL